VGALPVGWKGAEGRRESLSHLFCCATPLWQGNAEQTITCKLVGFGATQRGPLPAARRGALCRPDAHFWGAIVR
jgi:hypothetical protein